MVHFKSALCFILVSLNLILAHYELEYPAPRGFDEAKEPMFPCGGFNSAGPYTKMPLNRPFVQIDSGHIYYKYTINAIIGNNPAESDFKNNYITVGSGARSYPQDACLPIIIDSSNIKEGVNATIQIIYDGGDGLLYQCTDVTFTQNAANWDESKCKNADNSAPFSSTDGPKSDAASYPKALEITVFTVCLLSLILI